METENILPVPNEKENEWNMVNEETELFPAVYSDEQSNRVNEESVLCSLSVANGNQNYQYTVNEQSGFFPTVHSDEEAYQMYLKYARQTGFSVRKQHIFYWTHTRIIKTREYSCAKAGFKKSNKQQDKPRKFHHLDTRTGCKACLHFSADEEGRNWKVCRFIEEHNHQLAPENYAHLLRSHRKVSDGQAVLIKNMTGVGIRTTHVYNLLAEEVGGVENVGFTKQDAYNFLQRERRALIESGDAASLLEIFKMRQLDDNMFSFDVQTDEMSRLQNFLWIDGHAKLDYECFGDVLIFDTTYRLNKYNLPFAPFIAVNHHWQNVFIGGAFVAHETIESFCWVFETFLKLVGGKRPISIFTDQDQAMAVAIERVLPGTRHRLCQWHIARKAPSKVPAINIDKQIRSLFYNCMNKCDNEMEFEESWSQMITQGNLQENRWLHDLYNIKRKWSTTFNKQFLDLGILSTQRSESANSRLHGCSKATSSLVECFLGMEKLIIGWRRSEHEEDFKCKECTITLKFKNCPILKQMSRVYTRKIYSIFEESFMEGAVGLMVAEETAYDEDMIVYITRLCDGVGVEKQCIVRINTKTNDIDCSCMGFETKGILCKHALRIYIHRNVKNINPSYILRRFTLQVKKRNHISIPTNTNTHECNLSFRNHMMRYTYDLCQRMESCQIAKDYLVSVMNEAGTRIQDMIDHDEKIKRGFPLGNIDKGKGIVKDPPSLRPKGRPNARLKPYWETTSKKPKRVSATTKKIPTTVDVPVQANDHNFMDFASQVDSNSINTSTTDHFNDEFALDDDYSLNVPPSFSSIPDVFQD